MTQTPTVAVPESAHAKGRTELLAPGDRVADFMLSGQDREVNPIYDRAGRW